MNVNFIIMKQKRILFVYKNKAYSLYVRKLQSKIVDTKKFQIVETTTQELSMNFEKTYQSSKLFKLKKIINYLLIDHDEYRKDWETAFSRYLNLLFIKSKLNRLSIFNSLLINLYKFVEGCLKVDFEILKNIQDISPDAVVCFPNNWGNSSEYEVLRACKRLNIPTYNPIISIDNVFTKGILLEPVTYHLVWNTSQYEFLKSKHKIREENIQLTGSLYFEYFWKEFGESKATQNDLHDNLRILYLGSSPRISNFRARNGLSNLSAEYHAISEIVKSMELFALKKSQIPKLTIRTHPMVAKKVLSEKSTKIVEIAYDFAQSPKGQNSSSRNLIESIKKSHFVLGLNTSAMLVGKLFNNNTYIILDNEYDEITLETPHLRDMINSNVIETVDVRNLFELLQIKKVTNNVSNSALEFVGLNETLEPSDRIFQLIKSQFVDS